MEPLWSYDLITIIQCLDESRDRIRKEIAAKRATPNRLKQLEEIESALAELKIAYNVCRQEEPDLMPFDELFRFE